MEVYICRYRYSIEKRLKSMVCPSSMYGVAKSRVDNGLWGRERKVVATGRSGYIFFLTCDQGMA